MLNFNSHRWDTLLFILFKLLNESSQQNDKTLPELFKNRATVRPSRLSPHKGGSGGSLRHLAARRANAVPASRGSCQRCRHSARRGAGAGAGLLVRTAGRGQGKGGRREEQRADNAMGICNVGWALSARGTTRGRQQPQCHAEPTEAKAARPPTGGSVLHRGCRCWAHLVFEGYGVGKRWEAIGLQLAGALCCLPPMPTCGHRVTRQGGNAARRDSEPFRLEPWRWVLL